MIIMPYLSLQRPELRDRERKKDGNISSMTVEEFEKMIAKDELIEYAKYVDNYYGTPRAYVEEQLRSRERM